MIRLKNTRLLISRKLFVIYMKKVSENFSGKKLAAQLDSH